MIIVKVELHSARTGKVKMLAKMHMSNTGNVYANRSRQGDNSNMADYDGAVLRAPKFERPTREAHVYGHRKQTEPVWTLIAHMLMNMGYGAPYARQEAKEPKPKFMECDTCRAKPGSPILCEGCLHNRRLIEELTG